MQNIPSRDHESIGLACVRASPRLHYPLNWVPTRRLSADKNGVKYLLDCRIMLAVFPRILMSTGELDVQQRAPSRRSMPRDNRRARLPLPRGADTSSRGTASTTTAVRAPRVSTS